MNEVNETKVTDASAKKAKIQKILSIAIIVALALMIPVLVVNCTLIIKQLANPDVPPSMFGIITQYIDDDMEHLDIKKGDMIFIKTADPEDVEVGDAVFYKTASGKYILQEVLSEVTDSNGELKGWYTKEPNEAFGPNFAFTSQLIGEYNGGRIWGLGAVATFTQTVPGIIICMAIPLGLLVAYEVVNAKKKEKESADDKAELLAELEALRKAKAEAEQAEAVVDVPAEAPLEEPIVDPEPVDELVAEPEAVEAPAEEAPSAPEKNGKETQAE